EGGLRLQHRFPFHAPDPRRPAVSGVAGFRPCAGRAEGTEDPSEDRASPGASPPVPHSRLPALSCHAPEAPGRDVAVRRAVVGQINAPSSVSPGLGSYRVRALVEPRRIALRVSLLRRAGSDARAPLPG